MPTTVKLARPTYRFAIPEAARQFETDPKAIAMRPITADEERRANEVAEGAKTPLANELVRMATCEINGSPIDWNTDQPEWFERCSPKVRQLVFEAFARINRPTQEESAGFFGSMQIDA